jgi:hypothetical protein
MMCYTAYDCEPPCDIYELYKENNNACAAVIKEKLEETNIKIGAYLWLTDNGVEVELDLPSIERLDGLGLELFADF